MKNAWIIIATLSMFLGVACSSKKSDPVAAPVDTTPVVNPVTGDAPGGSGTGGTLTGGTGGATVTFVPKDFNTYNAFYGKTPLNSPKNITITVNLTDAGGYHYAGSVRIAHDDNGQTWDSLLEAGSGTNSTYDHGLYNGWLEAAYNYWFTLAGKTVFSGFFQDHLGAIVLVIDKSLDQGDGQGSAYMSGSVYFKNFPMVTCDARTGECPSQGPERKCWYITSGPWNCQSPTVQSKTVLAPTTGEGYSLLGTFNGMSRAKAFNL
jgi:hypothetical protein